MTEPTDRVVHPDPDTLADHAEGLLPSAQSAEVARHLLTCTECRDTRDALAEVTTLLTAYADPGPVPADVAARIDAALAAAGPVEADGADEDGPRPLVAPASTVVPEAVEPTARPSRTPFGSKVLQVAAVVVLLAALGGIGLSALLSHSSNGAGSGAGSAGSAAQDQNRSAASGAAVATVRTATGTAYTISNLGPAARNVLLAAESQKSSAGGGTAPSASSGSPAPSAQGPEFAASLPADQRALRDSPAALSTCVRRLVGAAITPLAVDLGTWEGTPATIIVLPGQDDPTQLDVFAVRASCPPGSFLGFARVPR